MSNCLTFAKFPFEKLVRQVVKSHNNSPMKISKEVFIVLQYFIEQQLTTLLRNANFAAIHAGRVKLMPIDIEFVNSIARGTQNPYQIGDIVHNEEDQIVNDEKEEEEEDNVEDEKEEDEDNCGEEDEELLEEE
jgi:histone H3/H4